MMEKLFIRKITSDDKQLFFDMSEEFYNSSAVLHPINASCHAAAFEEMMRAEDYIRGFILCDGENAVGYAILNIMFCREVGGKTVWIEELYIRDAYRGKGYGSEFFKWLKENESAARFRLEAEPSNFKAIKLYEKWGFCVLPYSQMVLDSDK